MSQQYFMTIPCPAANTAALARTLNKGAGSVEGFWLT